MKRTHLFLFLCCALLALTACQKEDHNGHLYGQWQLLTKTTLVHDAPTVTEDQKDQQIFWSFQLHLAQIKGSGPTVLARFNHHADSLVITSIYQNIGTHDTLLSPAAVRRLEPAGITQVPAAFKVEHLNDHNMTLRSDEFRLTFRKF